MKVATEFVGTFLFLFVIALVGPSGSPLTPLAIGGALMALVYMGGHRSGAHYNPAVSFALFLQKKITASEFGAYVVAQVVAGTAAFVLGNAVGGKPLLVAPDASASIFAAFVVETMFTLMLVLVVMNAAASRRTEGNSFYGLAIGITIVAAAIAGGPISGGAFNPAVALGSFFAALFRGQSSATIWVPIVGPLLGGAIGSYIWAAQESADPAPIARPAERAIDQPATGHEIRE